MSESGDGGGGLKEIELLSQLDGKQKFNVRMRLHDNAESITEPGNVLFCFREAHSIDLQLNARGAQNFDRMFPDFGSLTTNNDRVCFRCFQRTDPSSRAS